MRRFDACPAGCGGEDCVCCSIWIEEQADQQAARDYDPADDRWDDEEDYEEDDYEDDLDESMDGDHASALASAGFGTDEDYGDWGCGGDWGDSDFGGEM